MTGEFHCGHRRLRQGGEFPKGWAEGLFPSAGCVRVSLTYNHFKFSSNERWGEMAGEFLAAIGGSAKEVNSPRGVQRGIAPLPGV